MSHQHHSCDNVLIDSKVVQAAVEERARVVKEKELETARLRAKQERAADRQAEIDELRARRSVT